MGCTENSPLNHRARSWVARGGDGGSWGRKGGDAFASCKIKAGQKLLITAAICSHACPHIRASSKLSTPHVHWEGVDGHGHPQRSSLALELDAGRPVSLQVRLQTMELSRCLQKERVSGQEACRGVGAPHLRHCPRDDFGIGALLAFSPRALSADYAPNISIAFCGDCLLCLAAATLPALASAASSPQHGTLTCKRKRSQGQALCTLQHGEVGCPCAGWEQTGAP